MKAIYLSIAILFSFEAWSYDLCDSKNSLNTIAHNKCYPTVQNVVDLNEVFTLKVVTLTKPGVDSTTLDSIVLVPGGPGGDAQGLGLSLNQKGVLDALWAQFDLNVVLFDPRGTGGSQLLKSTEFYTPEIFSTSEQVRDLKLIVDSVSPNKPIFLLAHSAGGNTAAKFAALYPERVKGLILYSASIDTREIGHSNLRIFAKEFPFMDSFLESCPAAKASQLRSKWILIENFLTSVLKLQRLEKNKPLELSKGFYFKDFRTDMIRAIENDVACNSRVLETLKTWTNRISSLPLAVRDQVNGASNLLFDVETNVLPKLMRGTWIRTAVICSEGILKSEMKAALWLDGLNFEDDTCSGVEAKYTTAPSRSWLKAISAPTLFIGGTEDELQIPSAVKRNASMVSNSTIKFIEGGGHESHISHTMEFYNLIEVFIREHASRANPQLT